MKREKIRGGGKKRKREGKKNSSPAETLVTSTGRNLPAHSGAPPAPGSGEGCAEPPSSSAALPPFKPLPAARPLLLPSRPAPRRSRQPMAGRAAASPTNGVEAAGCGGDASITRRHTRTHAHTHTHIHGQCRPALIDIPNDIYTSPTFNRDIPQSTSLPPPLTYTSSNRWIFAHRFRPKKANHSPALDKKKTDFEAHLEL